MMKIFSNEKVVDEEDLVRTLTSRKHLGQIHSRGSKIVEHILRYNNEIRTIIEGNNEGIKVHYCLKYMLQVN